MKNKNAVLVLDVLLFECLSNASLVKLLQTNFFILLWTTKPTTVNYLQSISYNGYINGLRNGCKPYRYLRMYLRHNHPDVLCLPTVIIDFEKNYYNSRFGYDMCINICEWIRKQTYNNRDINIMDVEGIFTQIELFLQQYRRSKTTNVISEEDILSKSIVLTSQDILQQKKNCFESKHHISNKQFILTVGSLFFTLHHNVATDVLKKYLNKCYLVVWMNNKNTNKQQVQNFITTLKLNGINVNFMLFGLDRNVKSISYVRKNLYPTKLPFILVDTLNNIYDNTEQYSAFCDFDLYINLNEYLFTSSVIGENSVNVSSFYNMSLIFSHISEFLRRLVPRKEIYDRKVKISECTDDDDDDDDDKHDNSYKFYTNGGITTEIDDEWKKRITFTEFPSSSPIAVKRHKKK